MQLGRSLLLWTVGTAVVLLAIACARPEEKEGDIVIGGIGAMTGASAELGNNLRQGVEMALDQINGSDGINGRRLRVIYRDDEADPTKAVAALQELITKQHVVAIIGPTNTTPATALLPYVQEAKIVQMNAGATGTNLIDANKYPYTFRTIYYNEIMAREMVNYAVKVRGWQKLAILHDKTALGVGGGADLQRFVQEAGLTPTIIESYNSGEADLTPQVNRIRNSKPDAILSWALGADTAAVLKSMQKLGYKTPYVGYSGATLKTTRDLAGDALGDAIATGLGRFTWVDDPAQLSPRVKEFIEAREKKFGADDKVSLGAMASHYDATMLLAEAMKNAKSTDGDAVKTALEGTKDFRGIATDYSFSEESHESFTIDAMRLVVLAREWKGTFQLAPNK